MYEKIVIIGAGPTGLGAAYRLSELGYKNWEIYEKENCIGGLSASVTDEQGFTWDYGGHVIFSKFDYFWKLLDKLLEGKYLKHQRDAYIYFNNYLVPYPFQDNLRFLPKDILESCLHGLMDRSSTLPTNTQNWKDFLLASFGRPLCDLFFYPYNEKVWAWPLEEMSSSWIGERVSLIDIKKIISDIVYSRDNKAWGPNNEFVYPLFGGTGGLMQAFTPYIKNHLFLNKSVERVNTQSREIFFADNSSTDYDILINTSPVDLLIKNSDLYQLNDSASLLKHNSLRVVGLGINKPCPNQRCWTYFPQRDVPFFRLTNLTHYSFHNSPSRNHYSLMCDIAHSSFQPEEKSSLISRSLASLLDAGVVSPQDLSSIVSQQIYEREYAYPIPSQQRDAALNQIHLVLEDRKIFSRGRFGGWKYEVGNIDHSIMQGVEITDRLLLNKEESVYKL